MIEDLSTALDLLPDAVIWFDKNANLVEVNETAARMWGYSKSELKQMTVFDINPNMHLENWEAHWKEKVEQSMTFESTHRRSDGTIFPVEIMDHFINVGDRKLSCAIVRDITERKQLESKIRLSDFTIEQAGDAVFWLCPKGNIKKVNQAAIRNYGYTEVELKEMNFLELGEKNENNIFNDNWQKIKTQKKIVFEAAHITKEGKKVDVEINASYIEYENMEFACAFTRDITERNQKASALRGALMEIKSLKEKLEAENNYLQEEFEIEHNFGEIISRSPAFKPVLRQIQQVASTHSTVLITGESGTGKELIARAVHRLSPRNSRAMIKVNCAALPPNLIESELFGHEKGAFTGAVAKKIGKFELADGGTLFLDEIGELPLELQPKLLRALQEGEIERLGGQGYRQVDVRILTATNRNLEKEVAKGNFREDLFYRLNVFPIHSIPLRERMDDVPLLVRFFVEKLGKKMGKPTLEVPQKALDKLVAYDFPGNIRELENIIERAIITSRGNKLNIGNWLTTKSRKPKKEDFLSLEAIQKKHIVEVLKHTNWKVSGTGGAAEILGMRPTTLYSRMDKLEIKRSSEAI